MALPARPANYSINSGATYHPDYLWVFDVGEGETAVPNQGSAGTAALTMSGFDRSTDGTHGVIWSSVATNSDYAQISSTLGCTTACTMLFFCNMHTLPAGTSRIIGPIGGFFTSGNASEYAMLSLEAADSVDTPGRLISVSHANSTQHAIDYSTTDNQSAAYKMFALELSTTPQMLWSVDGGARSIYTTAANIIDTMDTFALSMRRNSSPAYPTDIHWLAAAVYSNTLLSDAALAAIYADPWAEMGMSQSTSVAAGAGAITVVGQTPITYIPPRRMTLDVVIR